MSMCTLGMARELAGDGIAVNSVWPRTLIATAAVRNLLGGEAALRRSRRPEIVADAAHVILSRPSRECTGNLFLVEDVLAEEGISDLSAYGYGAPDAELQTDLYVESQVPA
jgi:citronellol/citronellal dehydrogenase